MSELDTTYDLIAMDMDGTILRDDLTVSSRVRRSLDAARRQGVHLGLASGRGFASMYRWAQDLEINTPLICYQGALVVDPATRERLFDSTFPVELVREVTEFCRLHDLSLTLYVDEEIYVENKQHSDAFYERWFGLPYHLIDDLASALPGAPSKFIIIGDPARLDAIRPLVEREFGARMQIVRSHALFLEGLALGVTKASALALVAARLGVPRHRTMAIGDSGNDVPMIAWAGLGVAMGNASTEAKAVADYVAPSVEEDGAAEAIERFCLQGRAL